MAVGSAFDIRVVEKVQIVGLSHLHPGQQHRSLIGFERMHEFRRHQDDQFGFVSTGLSIGSQDIENRDFADDRQERLVTSLLFFNKPAIAKTWPSRRSTVV